MEQTEVRVDLSEHIKTMNANKKPLHVVMNDITSLSLTPVYTGHIRDVRDISRAVLLLNQKLPVRELQHLKRVRKEDVFLCPIEYLNGVTIEDYLHQRHDGFKNLFDGYHVVEVPKTPPKLRKQHEVTKHHWPCNFHPDVYLERLFCGNFFTDNESHNHRRYMTVAFDLAVYYNVKNVAVVVDPCVDSIVSMGDDNTHCHPIQHAAMLAIDNVAGTQEGGAWSRRLDWEALDCLKGVRIGHRQYKRRIDADGPYLCTGYDVYMVREPCLMCSMALVHARARRVFFAIDNCVDGAVKSRVMLQTLTSLNHRYEVFTGFL